MGTTILPADRSSFDVIMRQVGEAMSQTLPGAIQRGMERRQIQSGLSQLQNMSKEDLSKMNSVELIARMLQPFAGTEQGAAYAKAIIPEVAKLQQQQQQFKPEVGETLYDLQKGMQNRPSALEAFQGETFGKTSKRPQGFGIEPVESQLQYEGLDAIQNKLASKMGGKYFPNYEPMPDASENEGFRPLKPVLKPAPIGPAEERRMDMQLLKDGMVIPELRALNIAKLKQFQEDSYNAAVEGYNSIKKYQDDKKAEDSRFWGVAEPALRNMFGNMSGEETNILKGLARLSENVGSDEVRLRDVANHYDSVIRGPLSAFTDTGPILPVGSAFSPDKVKLAIEDAKSMYDDQINRVKTDAYLKKDPYLQSEITNYLRKAYRTSMAQKDFGPGQAAYVVSNLNDKVRQSIPKAPKKVTTFEPRGPGLGVPQIKQYKDPMERTEYIGKLADALGKLQQDDSLLLAREQAISNNYDNADFRKALEIAVRKNPFLLGDFQRQERPELNIDQNVDLDSWWAGYRSVLDLFKGKK